MPDRTEATEKKESKNASQQESIWIEVAEVLLAPPIATLGSAMAKGAIQGAADAAKQAQSPSKREEANDSAKRAQTPSKQAEAPDAAKQAQPPSKQQEVKHPKASLPDVVTDALVAGVCTAVPVLCGPAELLSEGIKEGLKQAGRAINIIDGQPRCKTPRTSEEMMNEILQVPTDVYNYFKNKPTKATMEWIMFPPLAVVNAKLDKCSF